MRPFFEPENLTPMTPASQCRPTRRPLWRALAIVASVAFAAASGARADELQDVSKLVAAGRVDDAEKRADAYLKANPKDAQMRFLKGVILSQRSHLEEAVAVFSGLTQDFPELPEPYNNLAVIYAAQGQYDKARGALETAVRVSPNDATAHENLGDVYAALAARAYRDARRYDSGNGAALRKLDTIRTLLTGPAAAAAAPQAATTAPVVPQPDPRSQRNVGLAQPAAPSTLTRFGAEAPEIIVPSVGTVVPQGSNVVGVGTPDSDVRAPTATLPDVATTIPPDPANPILAITRAVQRWAASRSLNTGTLSIRVDGDTATARFRDDPKDVKGAKKAIARNRALTLRRNGADWAVTDDRVES